MKVTGRYLGQLQLIAFLATVSVLLNSCDTQSAPKVKKCYPLEVIYPKYAKGFWIEQYNGFKVIHMRDAYDSTQIIGDYVLYPRAKKHPTEWTQAIGVATPVQKTVCLSTTQIGFLEILGITDSIQGVINEKRIFSPAVLEKLTIGTIQLVGDETVMNTEKIFALQPHLVMAYSFKEGSNSSIPKLQSLGLSVMMINDYNEREPLARAEWIKVFGAIYNREEQADSIFNAVEQEYVALRQLAQSQTTKPTVFCNLPFNDVWYMPSGDSYFANFINDAGGDFIWKSDTSSRVLNLDYEVVYAKAAKADYWLNPSETNSLNDISAQSKKFENFAAYTNKKIYNNNKRQTLTGGNDFWEQGVALPHLILKDLIGIFHPQLQPGHEKMYYKQLQ